MSPKKEDNDNNKYEYHCINCLKWNYFKPLAPGKLYCKTCEEEEYR